MEVQGEEGVPPGRTSGVPRGHPVLVPWWTGPQLYLPREKRGTILNSFEFVALEGGHPYLQGKALRRA